MDTEVELTEKLAPPAPAPVPRASLLQWLREGARTLVFRWPRWERLHATPAIMAALLVLELLVSVGFSRLYIEGGATFDWHALLAGWAGFILLLWACYVLRRDPRSSAAIAPDAAHLVTLLMAQALCLSLFWG